MLLLNEEQEPFLVEAIRQAGLDTLEGAFAYQGGEDLDKPGLGARRRTRLELIDSTGQACQVYLKRYAAMDRRARWQGKFSGGKKGSQAWLEMRNIQAVRAAGVPTMQALAWGQLGQKSYILVSSVPGEAVERCGNAFFAHYGGNTAVCDLFTCRLAEMAWRLHSDGLFHRDFYASHVFLDLQNDMPRLYMIDLARIIQPKWRQFRWMVKDLAQLKYSMPDRWVRVQWDEFLAQYIAVMRKVDPRKLERAIRRKVQKMTRHDQRRLSRPRGDS